MADTPLNPYALLGVTVAATCQDVRKSYYELALHAHPDKGGSAAQMRVVQAAYEYVMGQISQIDRSRPLTDIYAAAEHDFKRFLEEQTAGPTLFSDIFATAFDRPTFNDLWEQAKSSTVDTASHPGGYGDLMAASDITASTKYTPFVEDAAELPALNQQVQLYTEPLPLLRPGTLVRDLTVPFNAPVDDYTTPVLVDYRAAFAPILPEGIPQRESTLGEDTLQLLLNSRDQ